MGRAHRVLWLSRRKGQATIETGILFAAIIAALTLMSVYVERCVRGGFVQSAQAHGQQFSPSGSYSETRRIPRLSQVLMQDSGQELVRVRLPGDTASDDWLHGLPRAVLGAGKFYMKANSTVNWQATRDATYQASH